MVHTFLHKHKHDNSQKNWCEQQRNQHQDDPPLPNLPPITLPHPPPTMAAATTDQGYGNGITHPATHLSSLQRHALTLPHPHNPHKNHPAQTPRHRDAIAAPLAVRTNAVFVVKDDDINLPSQLLSFLPHANRNTASNGFSNKPKSSHQTPLRPPPLPTTTMTNPDHPPSTSKLTCTSWPQR